MLGMIFKLFK